MPEQAVKQTSVFWKTVRANIRSQHQAVSVTPVVRNGNIPLSFGQERLWSVEQMQPGTAVHNLRAVFCLNGPLNAAILEKSLQKIVQRHEILRTSFPAVNGQPVQSISENTDFHLPVSDMVKLPEQQQEKEMLRLAAEEAQQPFDVRSGSLLRIKLLRLSPEKHVLIRTVHHIIFDRWSDSVFMRELASLYNAFSDGKPSPLPDLPVQYADFVQFQRRHLEGEVLKTRLAYWKQQLNGKPSLSAPPLPADYHFSGASAGLSYKGASQFLMLSESLSSDLTKLSYREGLSLYVVLLAVFKILLCRCSGHEDIVVCSPVAGRNRVETKNLIGYFNNLILMRTWLGGNPNFRELANRVGKVVADAHEHQDLPLQHLAESLNIPGTIFSRAAFALQNVPAHPLKMANISVEHMDIEEGTANFDIFLSMKKKGDKLKGILRYKTDLFKENTIIRLLENFRILLGEIIRNPEIHLSDLPRFSGEKPFQAFHQPEKPDDTAPGKKIEQTIADVWKEVLQVDKVGIHTRFSDIGGGSLTLVRICSRLREVSGREISVAELFKYPTISGMARYLSSPGKENNEEQSGCRQIHDRSQKQKQAIMRQRQRKIRRIKSDE